MKSSPNLTAVVKFTETCKLAAYPDPKTGGAPWTVGWGATGDDVQQFTRWPQEVADARLAADIAQREAFVSRMVTVPLTQGQFDAIVDMVFNVGPGAKGVKDGIFTLKSGLPSTFFRKLSALDYVGARAEIIKWCSPGTNVEHGLKRRRTMDTALWDGKSGKEAIALGMLV